MSDESRMQSGPVSSTPEGGPIDEGPPASTPGAGQVRVTPEGGPLGDDATLVPPRWQEQLRGPIPGLDDRPEQGAADQAAEAPRAEPPTAAAAAEGFPPQGTGAWGGAPSSRSGRDDAELKKWPPYSGRPVSDIGEALRYAAPVVSQAEKLAIRALGLSGQGLSKLAGFLEERRRERAAQQEREDEGGGRD